MKTEQEFFRKFDMHVIKSGRKLRRVPNMYQYTNAWRVSISDDAFYQQQCMPIEEVDCVEILMPADRLDHIIDYIREAESQSKGYSSERQLMARFEQDRSVRLANPAVEKAYQKYVVLLELARK
jgi:hypothetical protein